MQAFVTGGSGFVGKFLIVELVKRGVEVRALARSDKADAAVRAAGAEPVRGDLDDVEAARAAMAGCDVVYHAAAYTSEHGKLAEHMRPTVEGTRNMLAAAREAKVKRFVHVSTEAVLADGKPIVRADETVPYPAKPAGPYPITKGLAERAVLEAKGDLEVVIIRPRFIWGAGDTSLTPKLIESVKRGKFAWIGGGRFLTSTCHIANVVEGALLAAEKGKSGEIYFLTDGEPVEFREFLTALLAANGVDAGTRSAPRWLVKTVAALTSWMTEPPVTRTAIALVGNEVTVVDAKARRELGYTGKMTREAGLAEIRAAR
ncbi:MAG: NAD-dependent epimerase/dehydratase family protein [Deltaproteobacteria bacterium]|nr:NAD-dependent epimerase/dehydratase family protein [Deltaproteobacteria bacterium]